MVIVQALPGSIAVFEHDVIRVVIHRVACRQEPPGQQFCLNFRFFSIPLSSILYLRSRAGPGSTIGQGYFQLPLGTGIRKCPFISRPMLSYPQAGAYPEIVLHAIPQFIGRHIILHGYAGLTAGESVRKRL